MLVLVGLKYPLVELHVMCLLLILTVMVDLHLVLPPRRDLQAVVAVLHRPPLDPLPLKIVATNHLN